MDYIKNISSYSNRINLLRTFAYILDMCIISLFYYFLYSTLYKGLINTYFNQISLFLIIYLLYFTFMEYFFGRTSGKFLFNLVVIDSKGNTPSLLKTLSRNIIRLLEFNILGLFGIIPFFTVVINNQFQRFGDIVAGTYILHNSDYVGVIHRIQLNNKPIEQVKKSSLRIFLSIITIIFSLLMGYVTIYYAYDLLDIINQSIGTNF